MGPGVPSSGSAPVAGLPSFHVTLFSFRGLGSTKSLQYAMLSYATLFFFLEVISCLFSLLDLDSKLVE